MRFDDTSSSIAHAAAPAGTICPRSCSGGCNGAAACQSVERSGEARLGHAPATSRDQWFVMHTLSRQEKALADELTRRGVAHFLPLTRRTHQYANRKITRELPLFPGYVFLHGTREQAYEADRGGRVAQIIRVADQDRLTSELDALKQVLSASDRVEPHRFLHRGAAIEVKSGPLRGMRGLVDRVGDSRRIVVQIKELGLAASVEIDAAELEPIR